MTNPIGSGDNYDDDDPPPEGTERDDDNEPKTG